MAVFRVIELIATSIDNYDNRVKYAQERLDEFSSTVSESKNELETQKKWIEEHGARYEEPSRGVDNYGYNVSLIADETNDKKSILVKAILDKTGIIKGIKEIQTLLDQIRLPLHTKLDTSELEKPLQAAVKKADQQPSQKSRWQRQILFPQAQTIQSQMPLNSREWPALNRDYASHGIIAGIPQKSLRHLSKYVTGRGRSAADSPKRDISYFPTGTTFIEHKGWLAINHIIL